MEFVYTPQQLISNGSRQDLTSQAFGFGYKSSRGDWSDDFTAAYNYLMKQQDNALQVALMNYQNQYNSPQNQMLLRQVAGINPYSDYSVQGAAASGVTSPAAFRSQGTASRREQATASKINSLLNTLRTGQEIYDYMTHGLQMNKWQENISVGRSNLLSNEVEKSLLELQALMWSLGMPGSPDLSGSPYGERYNVPVGNLGVSQGNLAVNEARQAVYQKQIDYLVEHLYPSQVDANDALKQLREQQYGIQGAQSGQWIHTSNPTADGILQFLLMMFRDSMRFGFSGKMF